MEASCSYHIHHHQLLTHTPFPTYDYCDPTALIQQMRHELSQWVTPPDPSLPIAESTLHIPTRSAHTLRTLLFQPTTNNDSPYPLIIFFHGGGYTMGTPETTASLCRILVQQFSAVCIAPSYRLAPEHPFPAGINDAWDSVRYIAANATSFSAFPKCGFLVGGVLAGGNFASVIAHLA